MSVSLVEFNKALETVFQFGHQQGLDGILDKCKYREYQTADILGHTVFENASGGKNNDDTYGADAFYITEDGNRQKAEYKSGKITDGALKKINNKDKTNLRLTMVYNGAYSYDNINRYSDVEHFGSIHNDADVVAIVKVDFSYIGKRLRKGVEGMKANPEKTTNCNSATVTIKEGKVYGCSGKGEDFSKTIVGEVVYLNPKYKVE